MKYSTIIFIFYAFTTFSQDCTLYTNSGYTGDEYTLNLNDMPLEIDLPSDHVPSWELNNNDVAIHLEVLNNLPDNYPFIFLNCAENSNGIGGGDAENFEGKLVRFSCIDKDILPQPTVFLPIDGMDTPIVSTIDEMPAPGSNVLVLKKAFLWLNSEDLDCEGWGNHGPWGAVSLRAYPTDVFESVFDYDTHLISEFWDSWVSFGEIFTDFRLPGPVYSATSPCWPDPNPGSEWIDGPWGICYSNIPILNWDDDEYSNLEEVFILLREGDENPDDYMGGQVVSKYDTGSIIIRHWRFGWIEVQNIEVPVEGVEKSIDIADYYWYNNWNGIYPDNISGSNPPGELLSQYLPLPEKAIDEMESTIPENNVIGLLGGKFPVGILDKPMIYVAPCESAIFNDE